VRPYSRLDNDVREPFSARGTVVTSRAENQLRLQGCTRECALQLHSFQRTVYLYGIHSDSTNYGSPCEKRETV
jgi:hypothetical protein